VTGGRPAAPPKPIHLGKNSTSGGRAGSPPKPSTLSGNAGPASIRLVDGSAGPDLSGQLALRMTAAEKDDYIRDFQKRFPSLTSIEMVERDLAAEAENGEGSSNGRTR